MAAATRLFPFLELVRYWRRRLGELHQYLADAYGHDRWLAEIRTRVFAFLLSRYGDQEAGSSEPPALPPPSEARPEAYCIVTPDYHPPRRSRHMRRMLNAIREANRRARPRWRWLP